MRTVLTAALLATLVACGGGESSEGVSLKDSCADLADAIPTGDLPYPREWKYLRRELDRLAEEGNDEVDDVVAPFTDPVDRLVADPTDLNEVVLAMGDLDDAIAQGDQTCSEAGSDALDGMGAD